MFIFFEKLSHSGSFACRSLFLLWVALLLPGVCLYSLPQGLQNAQGISAPQINGQSMVIQQNAQRAIANWTDFSIEAGESVHFNQPNANAAILNRVNGGNPSAIYGNLSANGQVYLVNPNGIFVGPSGVINAASFVGSTFDVNDVNFLAGGDLYFNRNGNSGQITNLGQISASNGDVFLISREIKNTGSLAAPSGTIGLSAGYEEVLLKDSGSERMSVRIVKDPVENLSGNEAVLENSGRIEAAKTELKAVSGNVYALAIQNTGLVRATGASAEGGIVRFYADGDIQQAGVVRAIQNDGNGGTIEIAANENSIIENTGSLVAVGYNGGTIQVTAGKVGILGASQIDASATQGNGGNINIGGGFQGNDPTLLNAQRTYVSGESVIKANAGLSGDGGNVIIWADGDTRYFGSIEAKGGVNSGNGGFVEVSGKQNLNFFGLADTSATFGGFGTLLLDPTDITISADGTVAANASDGTWTVAEDTGSQTIGADYIDTTLLPSTNVTLLASNDITLNGTIDYTGATNRSITLSAGNNIILNASKEIKATGVGLLNINLLSDSDGNGTGSITLNGSSALKSNGGNIRLIGGNSGYAESITILGELNSSNGEIIVKAKNSSAVNAITLTPSKTISSGSGSITLEGQSGTGKGIHFASISTTFNSSGGGAISIKGINNSGSSGIFIDSGRIVTLSPGNGSITVFAEGGSSGISGGTGAGLTLNGGTSNISLTTSSFDSANVALSATGSGTFQIQPSSAAIAFGLNETTSGFDLSAANLMGITNGFSQLIFGRSDGTGVLKMGSHTFSDPILVKNGSGGINVTGTVNMGSNNFTAETGGNFSLTGSGQLSGSTGNIMRIFSGESFINTSSSGSSAIFPGSRKILWLNSSNPHTFGGLETFLTFVNGVGYANDPSGAGNLVYFAPLNAPTGGTQLRLDPVLSSDPLPPPPSGTTTDTFKRIVRQTESPPPTENVLLPPPDGTQTTDVRTGDSKLQVRIQEQETLNQDAPPPRLNPDGTQTNLEPIRFPEESLSPGEVITVEGDRTGILRVPIRLAPIQLQLSTSPVILNDLRNANRDAPVIRDPRSVILFEPLEIKPNDFRGRGSSFIIPQRGVIRDNVEVPVRLSDSLNQNTRSRLADALNMDNEPIVDGGRSNRNNEQQTEGNRRPDGLRVARSDNQQTAENAPTSAVRQGETSSIASNGAIRIPPIRVQLALDQGVSAPVRSELSETIQAISVLVTPPISETLPKTSIPAGTIGSFTNSLPPAPTSIPGINLQIGVSPLVQFELQGMLE